MTRYLFGFLCVCALGLMPLVGCSETTGDGGSGGTAGDGGTGGMPECQNPGDCDDGEECTTDACASGVCENTAVDDRTTCAESNECAAGQCAGGACELTPVTDGTTCGDDKGTCQDGTCEVACTEQGIRDAVAAGGGPYTFDCAGPQTVVTQATIEINNNVILEGEGELVVDGGELVVGGGGESAEGDARRVFLVADGVEAELRGLTVSGGGYLILTPAGVLLASSVENLGTLALTNVAMSENEHAVGNDGTMTMTNVTVSRNGGGVTNAGTLTMTDSTVSEPDQAALSSGIENTGTMTMSNTAISGPIGDGTGVGNAGGSFAMTNCTVSGYAFTVRNYSGMMAMTNTTVSGGLEGIENSGTLTMTNATVSGHTDFGIANSATLTMTNSLVAGDCLDSVVTSNGHNIESPGDTCGFDQTGDQAGVSAVLLDLQPLANNGGPTQTHAITTDSAAFNAGSCEVDEDQRGVTRPQGPACDVGAFELEQ